MENIIGAIPKKLNSLIEGYKSSNVWFRTRNTITTSLETPITDRSGKNIIWGLEIPTDITHLNEQTPFKIIERSNIIPIEACTIDHYEELINDYIENNCGTSNIKFINEQLELITNYENLNKDVITFCNILLSLEEKF